MSTAPTPLEETILVDLAKALAALDLHEARAVVALAELGDIELPEGEGLAGQAERLAPLGPFYLAYQLEQAGLLRAAELIAGLYASGSITASIDTAGPLIHRWWQERRQRLSEAERSHLFASVFEQPQCDRLLEAVMSSLVALADHADAPDLRKAVALEQSCLELADFLQARAGGMVAYASRDIVSAINQAIRFMKDPNLLAAFAVRNLWDLVRTADGGDRQATASIPAHLDMGRSGQTVLLWLAEAARSGSFRLDAADAGARGLALAAAAWLQAQVSPRAAGTSSALRPAA